MRINHIAIWTSDIEQMRRFYMHYFKFTSGEKYINAKRGFTSYFLSSDEGGASIELMHMPDKSGPESRDDMLGLAHLAISVGSKENVNSLTARLRNDGCVILSEPRTTGDGCYESAVTDPEGNRIEITE